MPTSPRSEARNAALSRPVSFGPFVLDATQRQLTRDGQPLAVQPKTLELIICLVEHAGDLVTRQALMDRLWPDVVVTESSLARCVKEARRVLDDDASNPRYIATVPKAGYRFVGRSRTLGADRSESDTIVATQAGSRATPRTSALAMVLIAAALVVVAVIYMAGPEWSRSDAGDPGLVEADQDRSLDVTAINAERAFRAGEQALAMRAGSIGQARQYFERALQEDPRHAPAMAGLAMSLLLAGNRPPDPELQRRVLSLAERALSINPDLAPAHATIATVHSHFPRRYPLAEAGYLKALALDPELIEAYSGLAMIKLSRGEINEVIAMQRRALDINPSHTTVSGNLAINLAKKGRYEEAMELVESLEDLPAARLAMVYPKMVVLGLRGEADEVVLALLEGLENWPHSLFMARALARNLAALGELEHARLILDRIGTTCETVEERFFREAPLRMALGGSALAALYEQRRELPSFTDRDRALLWQGRLAFHEGDWASAADTLEALFPEPESVTGWQGDFVHPGAAAQNLAWSYRELGRETDARDYLDHIQSEIKHRWEAGYQSYSSLTVLEARNAAIGGDAPLALMLLKRALQEGWFDLTQLHDPRWAAISESQGFRELADEMAERAHLFRSSLQAQALDQRLQSILDAIPQKDAKDCGPAAESSPG